MYVSQRTRTTDNHCWTTNKLGRDSRDKVNQKILKKTYFFSSGWQNTQPHPAGNIYEHACASVPNGIVTIGGRVSSRLKNGYLYRNGQWSVVGQMQKVKKALSLINYF